MKGMSIPSRHAKNQKACQATDGYSKVETCLSGRQVGVSGYRAMAGKRIIKRQNIYSERIEVSFFYGIQLSCPVEIDSGRLRSLINY